MARNKEYMDNLFLIEELEQITALEKTGLVSLIENIDKAYEKSLKR